jgi:ribosome-associated translation inhibitor RaiA
MQIQINTDRNIKAHATFTAAITERIGNALSRFSDHVTRLEVHLSDENAGKSGQNDKRCMLEARLEGRQPFSVTHEAATVDQAVDGAVDKMLHVIENTLDRLHDRQRRGTGAKRGSTTDPL